MTTEPTMPDADSPSSLIERLIDQLAEIERGPLATIASRNALRHAKACEEWLAIHQVRAVDIAKRTPTGATE